MSAEIPWTAGPGETLPKAPAVGLCGEVVVTVDGGYRHTGPCLRAKYHDGTHTSETEPGLEEARDDPEEALDVGGFEAVARYTQAQWDSLAEVYAQACAQRDRALLDLQAARAAVAYWQAKAEGRS